MIVLGALNLAACSSDDGGKDTSDTAGTGSDGCPNSVVTTYPTAGDTAAFYRTNIEVSMAAADASATLTLADADGNDIAGTSTTDEKTVAFDPTDSLAPSSNYTATLSWGCDAYSFEFTTSETGAAVDASDIVGNTFSLALGSGRFVKPEGVGDLVGSLLEFEMLVGVTEADDMNVTMMGAISEGVGNTMQDMCTTTIDFPAADFSNNPFFEVQADVLPLVVQGMDLGLQDVLLSGALRPDGSAAEGVVLAGKLDTRPLVPLLSPGGADDSVCVLLQTFSAECEECADGSGPYCLTLYVDSMTAEPRSGDALVPLTEKDIAANADCAEK
jgi:hypothetical protein